MIFPSSVFEDISTVLMSIPPYLNIAVRNIHPCHLDLSPTWRSCPQDLNLYRFWFVTQIEALQSHLRSLSASPTINSQLAAAFPLTL